ncbi:hypothetical protein J5N97_018253 [Dioscorea zingiberensis]|uniref:soluble epoxide hydrolase n=1 Tax=Dioscorea zingiberensis TaxID=325984 RepID=A0A9D5CMJ1_9LILI|nr:hypothetical protein J5N97_018253 [Dioscorea zingiberensis]
METILHRKVDLNGISMHVAEKGEGGPIVLLLHGFPELWYSWRHQILGLAARGYHAVAPDLRGFGDTDIPPSPSSYTMLHLVGDILALINALGQDKVFVVGHDWGAVVAWHLCMLRPDKVKALVNLSVAFTPRNPARSPITSLHSRFGDDHYMVKFQKPGAAEAEFAKIGSASILKKFLTTREPNAYIVPKETGFAAPSEEEITLPPWLSEEDIDYYAAKFEKTGFTGGLNYYRCMDLNWELTAAWTGAQIKVPTKFIVGDLDLTYHSPGVQDYIHKGGFKKDVPFLEDVVVMEGVGHFITLEKAHEITHHVYEFIKNF